MDSAILSEPFPSVKNSPDSPFPGRGFEEYSSGEFSLAGDPGASGESGFADAASAKPLKKGLTRQGVHRI